MTAQGKYRIPSNQYKAAAAACAGRLRRLKPGFAPRLHHHAVEAH